MTGIIFAFVTLGVLLAASWFAIMKRSVLCTSRKWLGCLGDFSRLVKKKSLSHSGNPELKLKRGASGESGGRKDGISRVRVYSSRLIEILWFRLNAS